MGSYCSCSSSFKLYDEVILPKASKKALESIPKFPKEKQEKKVGKIKRFKTYNETAKARKLEKRKIIQPQDKNSFISSSSFLPPHKIITNSKINEDLIKELNLQYKPLDDNIAVEEVHSLQNPYDKPVKILEVQKGDKLDENDIVRLEDMYGRV